MIHKQIWEKQPKIRDLPDIGYTYYNVYFFRIRQYKGLIDYHENAVVKWPGMEKISDFLHFNLENKEECHMNQKIKGVILNPVNAIFLASALIFSCLIWLKRTPVIRCIRLSWSPCWSFCISLLPHWSRSRNSAAQLPRSLELSFRSWECGSCLRRSWIYFLRRCFRHRK